MYCASAERVGVRNFQPSGPCMKKPQKNTAPDSAGSPGFVLAADVGGTKIAAARVYHSGKLSDYRETQTPSEGGRSAVDAVANLLHSLAGPDARAVAVDVPGLAYPDGRVWTPNIAGWTRMPLRTALQKRLHLPVLVESDRNAFVVGEAWRGAARGCLDVVYLAIGTGIGAGILTGGRLLRGHSEVAGSVGWMAVRDQFLPEYKDRGCLETHAAGPGVATAGRRRLKRDTTVRDLVRMASRGDAVAQEILQEAGHYLGLALANLVSILNPEVIVIGGGVAAAGNLIIGPARQTMRRWAQPLAVKQVRIVRSRLGAAAALLGVARLAFETYSTSGARPSVR